MVILAYYVVIPWGVTAQKRDGRLPAAVPQQFLSFEYSVLQLSSEVTMAENKELARERQRRYRERHPERVRWQWAETSRKFQELPDDHPRKIKKRLADRERIQALRLAGLTTNNDRDYQTAANFKHTLRKFGMSLDDYETLLEKQGGVCVICQKPETAKSRLDHKPRRLAIDHDHKTGRVRGLLCMRCNNRLGWFEKDDSSWIESADRYLKGATPLHPRLERSKVWVAPV